MNLVEGSWSDASCARVGDLTLPFRAATGHSATTLTYGIRPADLAFVEQPEPDAALVRVTVDLVEELAFAVKAASVIAFDPTTGHRIHAA